MSGLVHTGEAPPARRGLLVWLVCIAEAQPRERYAQVLTRAGLVIGALGQ